MAIDETSVRIHLPQHVLEQVRAYQIENGINSFSAAVIQVLEQFFKTSLEAPAYAPLDRLEVLEQEVQILTAQLMQINQQLMVSHLSPAPPAPFFPAPEPTPYRYRPAQSLSYEDVEDEPDEILWDFMPPEGKP